MANKMNKGLTNASGFAADKLRGRGSGSVWRKFKPPIAKRSIRPGRGVK
jgi:hypothetical protein